MICCEGTNQYIGQSDVKKFHSTKVLNLLSAFEQSLVSKFAAFPIQITSISRLKIKPRCHANTQ